jgi:hypothetical protein
MRTTLRTTMTLTAASALLAGASVAPSGPAAAKPIDRGTIHEDLSFVLTDFCGVTGLDIDLDASIDFEYTVRSKGSAQLPYFSQFVIGNRTFTNPDNDRYVTQSFHGIEKDLRVTDNGDGTFTLLVLETGNSTAYGMDGKAIARNPGQIREEILIDNNGTPQDPSDDEFLAFIQEIKGSTGRTDDFCAAAVPALA